jgi:hypothetical protein
VQAVNEAEALSELQELIKRFIEEGVRSGEFEVTDTGFTAEFLLQGLHGALAPILHEQSPDREQFLVPARELLVRSLALPKRDTLI